MKQLLLSITLLFCINLFAQDNTIDSLKLELKKAKHDTIKIRLRHDIGEAESIFRMEYWDSIYIDAKKWKLKKIEAASLNNIGYIHQNQGNITRALEYYSQSLKIGEEIVNKEGIASSLNNIGYVYQIQGDIPKALEYYSRSLKIREEIGDKNGIANSLNNIGVLYNDQGDIPKALEYYSRSLKIQEEIGDKNGIAISLNNIGVIYNDQGDTPKALEYFNRSLKIQEEIGNKRGIANSLNSIGGIYNSQGDIPRALEYHNRSLKTQEEIGDKYGIANSLLNIGFIYQNQGDIPKALEYCSRSLKIQEEIGNKEGIAYSLNNIGYIYKNQGNIPNALEYFNRSLKIQEEIGHKRGIANSLDDIGNVYRIQGDILKALEYSNRGLKIREEIGDKQGIAYSLNSIGGIYIKQKNFNKALEYGTKSMQISKVLGFPENIRNAAKQLNAVYKAIGNYKLALENYELFIQMRDSITNEENKKASIKTQFQYQYEKKAATDSIANAKANEINNAQIAKQKAEIKAKRNQQYALYGGLALVLLFAGFVYNRLKITQKQKIIIEQKERETHAQKEIIEEKHKEITDSINYAERIQRSFLATQEMLDKYLGAPSPTVIASEESGVTSSSIEENTPHPVTSSSPKNEGVSRSERGYFVFFRPKDVVSGDFYWAAELNNGNFAFTCADSTGHGVPGAIMSILNISSLEKSVEKDIEPHQILNTTRRIIIDRLKKDGSPEGGKDGMDCSLLVLNKDKSQLSFASANNPVFILRAVTSTSPEENTSHPVTSSSPKNEGVSRSNNQYEILEYKPDKMPVGKHDKENEPFTLHTLQLQKGDVIYTLTDGFADQFGGKQGKKYMIKNIKELLLSIAHLPMPEQEQKLAEEFAAWKGSNEQVDDVCVIGLRI